MKPDRKLMSTVACALLLAAPAAFADGQSAGPTAEKVEVTFHGTTAPLRDIVANLPDAEPFQPTLSEVPIQIRPGTENRERHDAGPDPVLQWDAHPQLGGALPPTVSFDGVSAGPFVPPDTTGDVGPNHYVQWVNVQFAVYNKAGGLLLGPVNGNSLWSGFGGQCQSSNDGDPIVLYDWQADRWVLTQFATSQGLQCMAVSTGPDPTGSYHLYSFDISTGLNDYPKLGVWTDGANESAYLYTIRDFGGGFHLAFGGFERDVMLAGGANPGAYKFNFPCNGADCLEGSLPPHLTGPAPPAGTCPTFVTYYDAQYDDGPSNNDGVRTHKVCSNWGGAPSQSENPFTVGANFDRFLGNGFDNCISPTPGENLFCLAAFTMHAANYRWFGTHGSMVINTTVDADGTNRGGIRWGELRSTDGENNWSFFQEGTYAPADGRERWMGSIAMNGNGDIALGYSRVSGSEHPSINYVARMDGDPAGMMSGTEQLCHQGNGSQVSSAGRWGDYSRMSVDPTDDETFWYTQEYYATTSSFNWRTRVCSFGIDEGGGGGIPCEDIDKFLSRCNPNNSNLQARVKFFDNSHDGEQVTIELDGVPHVLTIFNNIAGFQQPGGTPGTHTFELVDPAGCFPQNVVSCPGD